MAPMDMACTVVVLQIIPPFIIVLDNSIINQPWLDQQFSTDMKTRAQTLEIFVRVMIS